MVSLLTVLVIQSRPTVAVTFEENGKFGWYSRLEDDPDHSPYLSFAPVFDTEEEAQAKGDDILKTIREYDTEEQREAVGE